MAGQPVLQEPPLHFFPIPSFLSFSSSIPHSNLLDLEIYLLLSSIYLFVHYPVPHSSGLLSISLSNSLIARALFIYLHRYSHLIASQPCLLDNEPEISRSPHLFLSSQHNSTPL